MTISFVFSLICMTLDCLSRISFLKNYSIPVNDPSDIVWIDSRVRHYGFVSYAEPTHIRTRSTFSVMLCASA